MSTQRPNDQADRVDPRATAVASSSAPETRGARFSREAHRVRLYVYLGIAVALLVVLIALVLANTSHVKVSWVFGRPRYRSSGSCCSPPFSACC